MAKTPKTVVQFSFGTARVNLLLDTLASLLNDHEQKVFMMKDSKHAMLKSMFDDINTALIKAQTKGGHSKRGIKREYIEPERRSYLLSFINE